MELLLRIGGPQGRRDDVVVTAEPDHTVAELTVALARHLLLDEGARIGLRREGVALDPDALLGEGEVRSGDELVLVPADGVATPVPGLLAQAEPSSRLAVDVVAGPDAGDSFLVPVRALPGTSGRVRIGRGRDNQLPLTDPSVSRHHLTLELGSCGPVVVPVRGAVNGVTVDGVAIDGPTAIDPDQLVGIGGTLLAIGRVDVAPLAAPDRHGRIDVHRTPYRPVAAPPATTITIGPIPRRPEPRRLQLVAVIAPLAAGLVMWAVTRQLHFLALTLVSPIAMIASSVQDRRTGRRNVARELAAFRERVADQRLDVERRRAAERRDRHRAAPDLPALVRRAEQRTIDLWARGRRAPDVLVLRLGLGGDRVSFDVALESGGDDDLRAEALAALDGLDRLDDVPVTVDLVADAVVGVHGRRGLVDGLAASLAVQAATLHSPEDLTIVAAVTADRPLGWLAWLPHLRSATSPLAGRHLVTTRVDADGLVDRLVEVAEFRLADGNEQDREWPRVLAVLDGELGIDAARVARLLDLGPAAGLSIVWLAGDAAGICRQATRTLALCDSDVGTVSGRLWSTDPSVPDRAVAVELLRPHLADRVARALAPVRDASTASLASAIPRSVPLLALLGVADADAIARRWRERAPYGLGFPLGASADGPVLVDLVEHGPHTLIAGTSGAGKSELLQSMVAGLAAHHPPTRLNLLFVDYKGGASSQVFERLPHTVGYVTNLSADLAARALTSLRAELQRRMAVMEGRAKDLAELLDVAPDDAPPSLVIVVDEFATLVREVPDFVAGIVDIAQRGRSLGIHLVLATQRPTGSVDENILANTNLRISLRTLDRSESSAIIGSPDAADIPVPLRGRGFVRLGPRHLVEFQAAHAGAPIVGPVRSIPGVASLTAPSASDGSVADAPSPCGSGPSPTHVAAVIDAIVAADRALTLPPPRRPWRDVLPAVVTLDDVLAAAPVDHPGREVVVGLVDLPAEQEQHPAAIDLEQGGGLLVVGSGGSGKTTLLRTIAAGVETIAPGTSTLVLDFASRGLLALRALPSVIDVAAGDDLEAVTRHLLLLDRELGRRRRLLAAVGAEHLTAYHAAVGADGGPALDRILVLIDGFDGLTATLLETAGSLAASDSWADLVHRIVVEGRQVGIHTVITAARRAAVPARLQAAIGPRLVLRHADPSGYADHGVDATRAAALDQGGGRALLGAGVVQIACLAREHTARSQADALTAMARTSRRFPATVLRSAPLPERLDLSELGTELDAAVAPVRPGEPRGRAPVIGRADVTGEPAVVDLSWSHAAVVGPPRSGRSTALATVLAGLLAGPGDDHDVYVVGPASSPLAGISLPGACFGRPEVLAPVLSRLAERAVERAVERAADPLVLVVDDADALDDTLLGLVWERLSACDGIRIVAAVDQRSMSGYSANPLVALARRSRRQLVLQPDDPAELLQTTGVRMPSRPGLRFPPGRGVLVVDREATVVQVAVPNATVPPFPARRDGPPVRAH